MAPFRMRLVVFVTLLSLPLCAHAEEDTDQWCVGQGRVPEGDPCYVEPSTLAVGLLCTIALVALCNFVSGLLSGFADDHCAGGELGGGPHTVGMGADGIVEILQHAQFYAVCSYINGIPKGTESFLHALEYTMLFGPAPYSEEDTRHLLSETSSAHGVEHAVMSWFYLGVTFFIVFSMNGLAFCGESVVKAISIGISESSKTDKAAKAVAERWKNLNIIPISLRFPAFPMKVVLALYQGLAFSCFLVMRSTYPLQICVAISIFLFAVVPVTFWVPVAFLKAFRSEGRVMYHGIGFQESFDNVFKLWDKNRKSISRRLHRIYMLKVIFATSGEWSPQSVEELDENDELQVMRTLKSAKYFARYAPLFHNYRGPYNAFYLPVNLVFKVYIAITIGLLGEWIPGLAQVCMIWPVLLTRIVLILILRPFNDRIDVAIEFTFAILDLVFLSGLLVYLSDDSMQVTFVQNMLMALCSIPLFARMFFSLAMLLMVGPLKSILNVWEILKGGVMRDLQTFVGNVVKAILLELKQFAQHLFRLEKIDMLEKDGVGDIAIDEVLDVGTKQTSLKFSDSVHKHLNEGTWGHANTSRIPMYIQMVLIPLEHDSKLMQQLLQKRLADLTGFDVNELNMEKCEPYQSGKFARLGANNVVIKVDCKRGLAHTLSYTWAIVLLCTSERPKEYHIDDVAAIVDAYCISDWGQFDVTFSLQCKPLPGRGEQLDGATDNITRRRVKITDPVLLEYENQGDDNYSATSSSGEEDDTKEDTIDFDKLLGHAFDVGPSKLKTLKTESKMGMGGQFTQIKGKLIAPSARTMALICDLAYLQAEFAIDQYEVLGLDLTDVRENKKRKKKILPSNIANMQRELYNEDIEEGTKYAVKPEEASPTRKLFAEQRFNSMVSVGTNSSGRDKLKKMRANMGSTASIGSTGTRVSMFSTAKSQILEDPSQEKTPFG